MTLGSSARLARPLPGAGARRVASARGRAAAPHAPGGPAHRRAALAVFPGAHRRLPAARRSPPSASRRSGCGSTAPTPRSSALTRRSSARSPRGPPARPPPCGRAWRRRHRRFLHDGQAGQDPARRHGAAAGRTASGCPWWLRHAGHRRGQRGGLRRHRPALGAPAGNAIVIERADRRLHRRRRRHRPAVAQGRRVEPLVSLVTPGGAVSRHGRPGAGPAARGAHRRARRRAQGGDEPPGAAVRLRRGRAASFDCSAWCSGRSPRRASHAAGRRRPGARGPAVPVSQLQPGDLLFYHTDPTAPGTSRTSRSTSATAG